MPVSIPADSKRNRFLLWASHQAMWIFATAIVVNVLADFFPVATLHVIGIASIASVFMGLYAMHYHGTTLCPLCGAATPLNGPEKALKRARALQWFHHVHSTRYALLTALVGAMGLGLYFFLGAVAHAGTLAGLPLNMLFVVSLAQVYFRSVHEPLEPWCPQCHWGNGGDKEPSPDPVPPSGAVVVQ